MADVSSELLTIVNGRYGADIRMAIHDALDKINKSSSSGGGGGGSGPVGNIKLKLGGYDDIVTSGFMNYYGYNDCTFAQDSSSAPRSSVTVTKEVLGQHTVLGIVMYTGQNLVMSDSSWVHAFGPAVHVIDSVKYNVEIYTKTATYETVSFSPATSGNEILCAKVVVLNQNETVSGFTSVVMDSAHHTTQPSLKDTLYLAVSSDDWSPSFTCGTEHVISMTDGQFCGFYMPKTVGSITIDYAKGQTLPSDNVMVVAAALD